MSEELLFKDEVFAIVGAAMDVYNTLGAGFLEAVYEEAMGIESELRGIPYVLEKEIPLYYKDRLLKKKYKADYIGFDKVLVELKCIPALTSTEEAQLLHYLKATKIKIGLLINFGPHAKLEWKRYIV
jgi:GxxExxY protein